MSTPPKDRRTMPPLPAAGVHPLAHDDPSASEAAGPGGINPTLPGQSDASPAGYNNPKASAINMTLLELQGDTGPAEDDPVHATEPAPAQGASSRSEPDLPPTSVTPPAEIPPTLTPTANTLSPGAESGASVISSERSEETEPSPNAETGAPAAGFLSSTPPLAGRLERPSQRPSKPGASATQSTTESPPSLTTVLIAAAVVSLLFGLLGAWAYDHFNREGKAQPEPAVVTAPSETPSDSSAAELEPLKLQLGELGQQVDAFEKQLAQATAKEPAPVDLAPIHQQIDGVAKSLAAIEPLAKRVEGITTRMEGLETSVNQLKDDLGSLEPKSTDPKEKTSSSSTPLSNTPTAVPTVTDSSEAAPLTLENPDAKLGDKALSEGIELFKAGKFEMAYAAFEKLEKTHPNDARVWYYAALSHGISKGEWGESTMNLVKKGVEREKAGTPSSAEIDAAFRDLNTDNGKEWLESKRKDVTK